VTGGRVVAFVIALVVVLLLILRLAFPNALVSLARPLWGAGNVMTAAVGSVTLESAADVKADRDRLQAELTARSNELATLQAVTSDIQKLGDISGRVVAGVLARPPLSPFDTLIVAPTEPVQVGAHAFGHGGVPVGTVERSEEGSAQVSLYSSAGRSTLGWAGETRIPIELRGVGSGAFRASVAKDSGIAIGDLVYVPGPGALPIGTVVRIDTDPSSPTGILFVKPLASPFSLTWIAIER